MSGLVRAADSMAHACRGLRHFSPDVSMKKIRFAPPASNLQSSSIFPGANSESKNQFFFNGFIGEWYDSLTCT